jgi:hypothetical protein
MATRLPNYLMRDGRTPLAQGYFNPIWADLDLRLSTLEALRVDWLAAVVLITDTGLARIDEVLVPLIEDAQAQLEALVEAAAGLTDVLVAADVQHYEPAKAAALTYDGNGRVSTLTETLADESERTTTYTYAVGGELATEVMVVGGVQRTTTYSYTGSVLTGWTVAKVIL